MISDLSKKKGNLSGLLGYLAKLKDPESYWGRQAVYCGIMLVLLIGAGVLLGFLTLSGVFGGGNISYPAYGSPGQVVFKHYTHMWFKNGKHKDCKTCHDKLFASQQYGTFILRALKDSPPLKVHIGKEESTLFVPGTLEEDEKSMVKYGVPRACATCATGACHDGKESFSRFECLGCHRVK